MDLNLKIAFSSWGGHPWAENKTEERRQNSSKRVKALRQDMLSEQWSDESKSIHIGFIVGVWRVKHGKSLYGSHNFLPPIDCTLLTPKSAKNALLTPKSAESRN